MITQRTTTSVGRGLPRKKEKDTHHEKQKGEAAEGASHVFGLQLLSVMYFERNTSRRHQVAPQKEARQHHHRDVSHLVFAVRKNVDERAASCGHNAPPDAAEHPLSPVQVSAVLAEQLKADGVGHGGGCGVAAVYHQQKEEHHPKLPPLQQLH